MNIFMKLISPKVKCVDHEMSSVNSNLSSCYRQVFTLFQTCGYDPILTIIKLQQRGCSPHLADYYTGLAVDIFDELKKEQSGNPSSKNSLIRTLTTRGLHRNLIEEFLKISKEMVKTEEASKTAKNKIN